MLTQAIPCLANPRIPTERLCMQPMRSQNHARQNKLPLTHTALRISHAAYGLSAFEHFFWSPPIGASTANALWRTVGRHCLTTSTCRENHQRQKRASRLPNLQLMTSGLSDSGATKLSQTVASTSAAISGEFCCLASFGSERPRTSCAGL